MIGKLRSSLTPIGVDLGARAVRAVQLRHAAGRYSIHAATAFEIPLRTNDSPRSLGRLLLDVFRRQDFRGNRVVLTAPHAFLHTDLVELPALAPGAPVEQLARMELVRMHRMEPDSFEMVSWPISPVTAGRGVGLLTVSCPHAPASQLLDDVESDGLNAAALVPEACALARVAALAYPATGDTRLILSLGWSAARFFAVRGTDLLYQRNLEDIGIGRLHAAILKAIGPDPDAADYLWRHVGLANNTDAGVAPRADITAIVKRHAAILGEELNTSLDYLNHAGATQPGSTILLCGQGACMPGLTDAIHAATQSDIQLLSPRSIADAPMTLSGLADDPAMTAALGLTLHDQEVPA